MPDYRVLVQKKGVQGKHKIGDIWEHSPYVVKKQPMPDILVYLVQRENSNKKPRLLHRNMLLLFNGLPRPQDEDLDHQRQNQEQVQTPEINEPIYSDHSSDSSSEDDYGQPQEAQPKPKKYIIPARRGKTPSTTTTKDQRPRRRGQRRRAPPRWMQQDDWELTPPHVINMNAKELVYI